MKIKRKLEVAVISDVHLGTYDCHAVYLLIYLNSIEPKKLILNGDIIDMWHLNSGYFPKSHLKVIKKLISMAANGVEVIYITGNHDELLRNYSGAVIGNISIVDKKLLELDGKKAWLFHGDVFDLPIKQTKYLAKLGKHGFNFLFFLNRVHNFFREKLGKSRYSFVEKMDTNNNTHADIFAHHFESTIADLAIEKDYDYVICGHTHKPKVLNYNNNLGHTIYLNSGDWTENFTALEYQFKRWKLYHYKKDKLLSFSVDEDESNDQELSDLIAAITIVNPNGKEKSDKLK